MKLFGGASAYTMTLPFTMGVVAAPLDPNKDGDIILQWLAPPVGPETAAGGRRRQAVAIFGTWRAYSRLPLEDAGHYEMPAVQVSKYSALIGPIELDDGKAKFATLDAPHVTIVVYVLPVHIVPFLIGPSRHGRVQH